MSPPISPEEETEERLSAIAARLGLEVACCFDDTGAIFAWEFFSNEQAWLLPASAVDLDDDSIEALITGKRSATGATRAEG